MNGEQPRDPEITYTDPKAYILYLRSRRMNPDQITQLVRQRFGAGQSPQDRAKKEAEDAETANLAGLGGQLAGLAGTGYLLKSGLFSGGASNLVASPLTQAAWNAPGLAASQAGATATGLGTGTGASTMPSLSAAAPYAAAAAAAIAAGYNLNRWSKKGKTYGAGEGLKEAAKDPLNYLIPTGFIGAAFGDKDMYLKEHRRLLELKKQGVEVPESLLEGSRLAKGRSKEELIDLEKKKIEQGGYGNVKFAESRNEADLNPEDIVGYSTFMKKFGNDWFGKFNQQQRLGIAKQALDLGAVREQKGTIDIDWNKLGSTEDLSKLSFKGTAGVPGQQTAAIARPGKGEVGRQSAGLYRDDTGKLVRATSMRQALERSYGKTKKGK